jgi:uncharacterized membrane protein YczE
MNRDKAQGTILAAFLTGMILACYLAKWILSFGH